jgi:predicted HicB family RNase H-like nuclease
MKEITLQDAQEIVSKINNKKGTRTTVSKLYGMSENTLSRRLKHHGYVYNQSTKKYDFTPPENTLPKPEIQEVNNQENKKENKTESNPSNKQEKKETKKPKGQKESKKEIQQVRKPKKVTYEIDEDLHFELRMRAFREKKNVSELVEQAIRQYLNH